MKGILSILIVILLHLSPGDCYFRCHQCDQSKPDCHWKSTYLYRCPAQTRMCYIRISNETFFERGCLTLGSPMWKHCRGEENFDCYTCHGENCNGMAISAKSQLNCVQCQGEACATGSLLATPCPNNDTILGPAQCTTKYADKGMTIASKHCLGNVPKANLLVWGVKYFHCADHACNQNNKDSLMRCAEGRTFLDDHKLPPIKTCFEVGRYGVIRILSYMMGCTRKMIPIYLPKKNRTLIHYDCMSAKTFGDVPACQYNELCQMCMTDKCNVKMAEFTNKCYSSSKRDFVACEYMESLCYTDVQNPKNITMGCVGHKTPRLYDADMLLCKNEPDVYCQMNFTKDFNQMRNLVGCYECSNLPCDDVLTSLGYLAKTICPLGVTQCYSSRSSDGLTYRGCYDPNSADQGMRLCLMTKGGCVVCKGNYCNWHKVIPVTDAQCYKTNWRDIRVHEASLRLADCTGSVFEGRPTNCYVASSSRLLMRMGCVSELVAGVDETYNLTYGDTSLAWILPNSCYKCKSNVEGYCFDTQYLEVVECRGLNMFPVRGCYTLIDSREKRLERGCVTELTEYMIRLCDLPIFNQKCHICAGNGCNSKLFLGFKK